MTKSPRTPSTFATECLAGLRRAEALRPKIVGEAARTVDEALTLYNELLTATSASNALAGLLSEVHPDERIRDAARACEQEVARFNSELALDRDMYDALAAIDISTSDPETQRFLSRALRDYRRDGVDKPPETRARLKQIDEELTRLGQQFSKNISEDVRFIEVEDVARLAGLPPDFIAAHAPEGAATKIRITTDSPDYNPFMTYADDDELRKELYIAFRSRAEKQNETVLQDILELRAEKSSLLGFKDWADYITADKMIGSGDRAAQFIEKVWKLAEPRAEQDYKELLSQLQRVDPKAKHVADWQKFWLEYQVKKDKYEVDSSEVRLYFPYERVLAGLLEITSEIFDLRYEPVADASIRWHASVLIYDVVRGEGTKLGRIYLDMHPREGKYKHAAQFPLKDGVRGVQLPEGVLVCNFPPPTKSGVPALLEHDDVVTMFHEFGHLMHHILGGHQRWITQSGVATEWDFVEAPSQMFEEWAWSYDTLARFARHHETGEVIPQTLVDKMRRADKFGLGTATVQQIFYASISLNFHRTNPDKLDQLAEVQRLQKKYTPFAYVPGTRFHTSFGHLVGYSAMYYTYQWSLVIAKDLLTPFQKHGLMSRDITFAYRDKILAPGGSRDAAELVRDFLGRDYDFKAYEQFLVA